MSTNLTPATHPLPSSPAKAATDYWDLRLYVAGQTEHSVHAFDNLNKICEQHLAGKYRIEVIDLLRDPKLARGDQIVALPTLVRKLPEPIRNHGVAPRPRFLAIAQ